MTEACPLCNSADSRITYTLDQHNIAECVSCGFEFHAHFRGGGDDDQMFSDHYYRVVQKDAFEAQFADHKADPSAPVFGKWLDWIEARHGKGRLLDVGSALGTFLKIAQDRGFDVQGVELSRFAAEFARDRRGLNIFNGDLEEFTGGDGSFDVVTFWDSIEHVTHPRQNLRTAHRLLKPGGVVLLATDNFDCLICDVARLMYRATFGRVTYAMRRVFVAPNRSYFTESVFRRLVETSGFRIVEFKKMEYPLAKINANIWERLVLGAFYALGKLLNRQAQMTVVAQKP